MTQKILTWKAAYDEMRDIAGEAIGLADAYAGGDSDNAKELNRRYEELDLAIQTNPPKDATPPTIKAETRAPKVKRIYSQVPKGYYAVESDNKTCKCSAGTCVFYEDEGELRRGLSCESLELRCVPATRYDGLNVIFKKKGQP